jgi:hypothetical protein
VCTLDQNNDDIAKLAIGRRIAVRLQACRSVGCSATDEVIVAALAANEQISAKEITTSFTNPKYLYPDGSFNWDAYLQGQSAYNRSYIKTKLIPQFLEDIDSEHRYSRIDWDYIEGLTK